jgi:arylesterase / paraoxonase
MRNAGKFDVINSTSNEKCTPLTVSSGTEDVVVDKSTDIVFVSADDRRKTQSGPASINGIYAFSLDDPSTLKLVSTDGPEDFHPHGISLWSGETEKRLFVVNHLITGENSVEIYSIGEGGSLSHIKSVVFDDMQSPNDVHAVGPEAFYVTNDRGFRTGFMSKLEGYLGLPFASVAYYDGIKGRKVIEGLTYANGINQSPDGKHIYVSQVLPRSVTVYARNEDDGGLEKLSVFETNSGPDNIDVDQDGILWVAGHSNLLTFLAHAKDPTVSSPSHILRIDPMNGAKQDIFYDTGALISASSVGAVHKGTLIIGAVFDDHVLICPLS